MDSQIRVGDTIQVSQKVQEAKRERIVNFKGTFIKSRGKDENRMITVRSLIDGVYVDRIFPVSLPTLTGISLVEKRKKTLHSAKLLKLPTK